MMRARTDRPSIAISNFWPRAGARRSRRTPSGRARPSFFIFKKSCTFVIMSFIPCMYSRTRRAFTRAATGTPDRQSVGTTNMRRSSRRIGVPREGGGKLASVNVDHLLQHEAAGPSRQPDQRGNAAVGGYRRVANELLVRLYRVASGRLRLDDPAQHEGPGEGDRPARRAHGHGIPFLARARAKSHKRR